MSSPTGASRDGHIIDDRFTIIKATRATVGRNDDHLGQAKGQPYQTNNTDPRNFLFGWPR
jgi:hypothetical protein